VDRATALANQMLALAKVEQLRQQGNAPVEDWSVIVRELSLDIAPLIAEAGLDFGIDTAPAPVRGHAWALRELTRNLLHNAIKHSPRGGELSIDLRADGAEAVLHIADAGPGLAPELRQRLFEPFSAAGARAGSGLGLAICHEIVHTLGGRIALTDRQPRGLLAEVRLPLATA
jgi:two-component system sensor histidine kinase TctE